MCIEIKSCEVPCFTCQLDSDLRITSNTQQRTAELHGTATPAVYREMCVRCVCVCVDTMRVCTFVRIE